MFPAILVMLWIYFELTAAYPITTSTTQLKSKIYRAAEEEEENVYSGLLPQTIYFDSATNTLGSNLDETASTVDLLSSSSSSSTSFFRMKNIGQRKVDEIIEDKNRLLIGSRSRNSSNDNNFQPQKRVSLDYDAENYQREKADGVADAAMAPYSYGSSFPSTRSSSDFVYGSSASERNESFQIIKIVRVSSTSIGKPKPVLLKPVLSNSGQQQYASTVSVVRDSADNRFRGAGSSDDLNETLNQIPIEEVSPESGRFAASTNDNGSNGNQKNNVDEAFINGAVRGGDESDQVVTATVYASEKATDAYNLPSFMATTVLVPIKVTEETRQQTESVATTPITEYPAAAKLETDNEHALDGQQSRGTLTGFANYRNRATEERKYVTGGQSEPTNSERFDTLLNSAGSYYTYNYEPVTATNVEPMETESGEFLKVVDRSFTKRKPLNDETDDSAYYNHEEPEQVHGEPERVHSVPEEIHGVPEQVHGLPEQEHGLPEQEHGLPEQEHATPEQVHATPEQVHATPEQVHGQPEQVHGIPEHDQKQQFGKGYANSENYGLVEKPEDFGKTDYPSSEDEYEDVSDENATYQQQQQQMMISSSSERSEKKSSYIVDNGNYRKYRVEERTADGFIVGEYGIVSRQDGTLRGVRYTADSNINPSIIYETLVKFLSLK